MARPCGTRLGSARDNAAISEVQRRGGRLKLTPTIADLVAIRLRFDGVSSGPLAVRAIGQLLAKRLFTAGSGVSKSKPELVAEAGAALGVGRLGADGVDKAIAFLIREQLVKESGGRYLLTPNAYAVIAADVARANKRVASILDRHFPGAIDRIALTGWFNAASAKFFGLYGSQWAALLQGKVSKDQVSAGRVSELLRDVTKHSVLNAHEEELVAGFHRFLSSSHPEDTEHQWSLGQSLLAAKLVAANIGPDPVTAESFRGATLLLDTNALMVAALERHTLSESLSLLAGALSNLGVSLAVIEETRDEYVRVMAARSRDLMTVARQYGRKVLEESSDPLIATAIARRCFTEDDFRRFADSLLDPPTTLGDRMPIEMASASNVRQWAEGAARDVNLKKDIGGTWAARRSRKKSERAVEHDAALTGVVEGMHLAGQPASVLTLDRTMQEHAQKRAGAVSLPRWVSLDALIQVLAVDGAGPGMDATNYGPLLASIIRHQCEPALDTYTVEDLAAMVEVEERCAELPPDQVQSVALAVARKRLAGASRDDPELQLVVRRAFQKGQKTSFDSLATELAASKAAVRGLDDRVAQRDRVLVGHRKRFVRDQRKKVRKRVFALVCAGVIGCAALSISIVYVANRLGVKLIGPSANVEQWMAVLPFLISPWGWFLLKYLPRSFGRWRAAESDAAREFDLDSEEYEIPRA